jgi:hypothetical protein
MKKAAAIQAALAEVMSKPSVSIPTTGLLLGELSINASYDADKAGTLGAPSYAVGGKKKRVPSMFIRQKLGLTAAG